ncbi:MAG: hypothetical protein ACYCW6_22405 [Candidatus Xenobia bacterium]
MIVWVIVGLVAGMLGLPLMLAHVGLGLMWVIPWGPETQGWLSLIEAAVGSGNVVLAFFQARCLAVLAPPGWQPGPLRVISAGTLAGALYGPCMGMVCAVASGDVNRPTRPLLWALVGALQGLTIAIGMILGWRSSVLS